MPKKINYDAIEKAVQKAYDSGKFSRVFTKNPNESIARNKLNRAKNNAIKSPKSPELSSERKNILAGG